MAISTTNRTGYRSTSAITWVAFWLLVIGGLNWLLVGLFEFDLVAALLGAMSPASRVVYTLVGIAAIYCAASIPAFLRKRTEVI